MAMLLEACIKARFEHHHQQRRDRLR